MNLVETLQQIHDEADHILGTEADLPLEVARVNAKNIKELAQTALTDLTKMKKDRAEAEYCSVTNDGQHCDCWHDGEACCSCKAPEMTRAQRLAQGMEE